MQYMPSQPLPLVDADGALVVLPVCSSGGAEDVKGDASESGMQMLSHCGSMNPSDDEDN